MGFPDTGLPTVQILIMELQTLGGQRVCIRPFSTDVDILAEIFHSEIYGQALQPQEDDIVIDVGAHAGFFALWSRRKIGPKGLIVSIEPDPTNFQLLQRNVSINGFANIIPINEAAADFDGFSRLSLCSTDTSAHSLAYNYGKSVIKTKVSTLDAIAKRLQISHVDFVKIDAEGSELMVLRGAEGLLEKGTGIVIESHNRGLALKVGAFLSQRGYEVTTSKPSHLIWAHR